MTVEFKYPIIKRKNKKHSLINRTHGTPCYWFNIDIGRSPFVDFFMVESTRSHWVYRHYMNQRDIPVDKSILNPLMEFGVTISRSDFLITQGLRREVRPKGLEFRDKWYRYNNPYWNN